MKEILIVLIFMIGISPVYAEEESLLKADFENQDLTYWRSGMDIEPYWEIKEVSGNYVLSGQGPAFIDAGSNAWKDYSLKVNVKRIAGAFEVGFRISQEGRYYIGFNQDKSTIYLGKNKPWGTNFALGEAGVQLELDKWHEVNIALNGESIKVFINEELKIEHIDTDPLLQGCISLISGDKSTVYFDDVMIMSIE